MRTSGMDGPTRGTSLRTRNGVIERSFPWIEWIRWRRFAEAMGFEIVRTSGPPTSPALAADVRASRPRASATTRSARLARDPRDGRGARRAR